MPTGRHPEDDHEVTVEKVLCALDTESQRHFGVSWADLRGRFEHRGVHVADSAELLILADLLPDDAVPSFLEVPGSSGSWQWGWAARGPRQRPPGRRVHPRAALAVTGEPTGPGSGPVLRPVTTNRHDAYSSHDL